MLSRRFAFVGVVVKLGRLLMYALHCVWKNASQGALNEPHRGASFDRVRTFGGRVENKGVSSLARLVGRTAKTITAALELSCTTGQ